MRRDGSSTSVLRTRANLSAVVAMLTPRSAGWPSDLFADLYSERAVLDADEIHEANEPEICAGAGRTSISWPPSRTWPDGESVIRALACPLMH